MCVFNCEETWILGKSSENCYCIWETCSNVNVKVCVRWTLEFRMTLGKPVVDFPLVARDLWFSLSFPSNFLHVCIVGLAAP